MRRRALAVLLGAVGLALLPAAPALAHPLGNFTVNTADHLEVTATGVQVLHIVDTAELPSVQLTQTRRGLDLDGDGTLNAAELTRYAAMECARVAPELDLRVDGSPAALQVDSSKASSAPGAAGLPVTRLECLFSSTGRPSSGVDFSDPLAAQRNGWREVTASSACGPLTGSTVPQSSPSNLLRTYPADLLSSPVDVTTGSFSIATGAACTAGSSTAVDDPNQVAPRGLDRISQLFTDFTNPKDLSAPFAILAVLASIVFGALHAIAPGHGKTVMAAYMVGQRGSRRQALQLGAFVTFSHTASVLALGAALSLGSFLKPELVVPATEVLSGVLLAAVGVYLLVLAARRLRGSADHSHLHDGGSADGAAHGEHGHGHDVAHPHPHPHDDHVPHGHGDAHAPHEHPHPHDDDAPHGHDDHAAHEHPHDDHAAHEHPHDDDHVRHAHVPHARLPHERGGGGGGTHAPDALDVTPAGAGGVAVATRPLEHSHGGRAHSHAPLPEGKLGFKALAAVGVAGGLVPSPSALLVLLGATALGRAWFGVLLVLAYGIGMAVTLTVAGLLLLRARVVLDRRGWSSGRAANWVRLLPIVTAGLVLVLGLVLAARGIRLGSGLL